MSLRLRSTKRGFRNKVCPHHWSKLRPGGPAPQLRPEYRGNERACVWQRNPAQPCLTAGRRQILPPSWHCRQTSATAQRWPLTGRRRSASRVSVYFDCTHRPQRSTSSISDQRGRFGRLSRPRIQCSNSASIVPSFRFNSIQVLINAAISISPPATT